MKLFLVGFVLNNNLTFKDVTNASDIKQVRVNLIYTSTLRYVLLVSHTCGCCGQPDWQQWTMCQLNELCSGNTLYVGTSRDIDSVVSEEVVNRQFPLLITVVFTVMYFILTAM